MAVSVPKRLFKRAVDRNLLKRRMREAYRLNKAGLYDLGRNRGMNIQVILQYQQQEISSYSVIEEAVRKGLNKIAEKLKDQD
jgi:ribonuclease P protein component